MTAHSPQLSRDWDEGHKRIARVQKTERIHSASSLSTIFFLPLISRSHAFHKGLEAYGEYTKDCAESRKTFDGAHIVSIIDSFGAALTEHLTDEIKTLLGLRRFGEETMKDYPALGAQMGQNALVCPAHQKQRYSFHCGLLTRTPQKHAGFKTGLLFMLVVIDRQFEGGRWSDFPPAPGHILFLLRNVFYYFNKSWWKFGPCDTSFKLRPLYAVPSE
jgi:hypothetical protein